MSLAGEIGLLLLLGLLLLAVSGLVVQVQRVADLLEQGRPKRPPPGLELPDRLAERARRRRAGRQRGPRP